MNRVPGLTAHFVRKAWRAKLFANPHPSEIALVLVEEGVTDFAPYAAAPGAEPAVDLFVDEINPPGIG